MSLRISCKLNIADKFSLFLWLNANLLQYKSCVVLQASVFVVVANNHFLNYKSCIDQLDNLGISNRVINHMSMCIYVLQYLEHNARFS